MKLAGKAVLVTGASKGIGRAIALAAAAEGANVIVNYAADKAGADEVVRETEKLNVRAMAVQADVSKHLQVEAMIAKIVAEFETIDVLVNNAGIFDDDDRPENVATFHKVFETNFLAQVLVTNAVRPHMTEGKIIFISSIHGRLGHGSPDAIAYSSMKAALNSYMKNLAKDLAPKILVNAVAPGRVLTPMWGEMDAGYKAHMAEGHLIERWIEPEEIADAVLFMAKNDAVCGEILTVDGGMGLKILG